MRFDGIEVLTLFCDDLAATREFYGRVFEAEAVFEDEAGAVLSFSNIMVNLLASPHAPELVEPLPVAPASTGTRLLLTIKVLDVDAQCARLAGLGVKLLNGPVDRPWARRTAAFADPAGFVWELAEEI